jgi:hypothetical protein
MSTLITRRSTAMLVATGALLFGTLAVAPDAGAATLYACVKKNGTPRVLTTKKPKCKKGETKLSWNIEGIGGKNGKNGMNGINGINGINGKDGKDGAPGQPQKAVKFSSTLEAPFLSNKAATLFNLAGVSVRLNCINVLLVDVANLEATGPAGSQAVSGMVASRVNNSEGTQAFQRLVYNVGLSAAQTTFGALVTNASAPIGNVAHVNATIVTPNAMILMDTYLEVNEVPENCKAIGSALTVPL